MLTTAGVAHLVRKPEGETILTNYMPLPDTVQGSLERVAWYKLSETLPQIGIGLFQYGDGNKSILESMLDPKPPSSLPPALKIELGPIVTIRMGDLSGSMRQFTNGEFVFLTHSKMHAPSNHLTVYENNIFESSRPVSREVYSINDSDGKRMDLSRVEVNQWEVKSHDDSLFRLSRYGLPEIDDGELPVQPPYLLYGGIALGLLVAVGVAAFFIKKYGTNKSA